MPAVTSSIEPFEFIFPKQRQAASTASRKLFPSRVDKVMKKMDALGEQVQESLRSEENAPIDD
jgi:hypothetical protein